jgi:hypothetical protein
MTTMEDADVVPMRETVKRGLQLIHEKFNREHSEFLMLAASEMMLDPVLWKPNFENYTFEKVKT